jgi:phage shock protein E
MNMNDVQQYALPVALLVGFLVFKRLGQISSEKAHALVQSGAVLIDVRSAAEFSSGHLNAAKNVPLPDLSAQANSLGPKNQPMVVYCASGTRSAIARRMLKTQGFTEVYNLGAMSRWKSP